MTNSKKEELLDLDDVCPNAPAFAKGAHSMSGWTEDEGTHYWCQWGCGRGSFHPAPEKDFWGREIDPWFERNR